VIIPVPAATPVAEPLPEPTVTTDVVPLLHTPPDVVLLKLTVDPAHMDEDPRIADGKL